MIIDLNSSRWNICASELLQQFTDPGNERHCDRRADRCSVAQPGFVLDLKSETERLFGAKGGVHMQFQILFKLCGALTYPSRVGSGLS